jgi:single-stranded-DNA-specific exonuclease
MQKKWVVAEKFPAEFGQRFPDYPPAVLQLLWNRGLTQSEAIREFMTSAWERDIHDPFLFRDMKKAVERIFRAIDANEKIYIFADYDADGVDAGTILTTTLAAYGAQANIYIPHRESEGYGLNDNAVRFINEQGAKLLITCDCGISNAESVAVAAGLGVDVIITDHHQEPAQLPDKALALIHPKLKGETYPCKYLSGGGVAFKLAQGLIKTRPLANGEAFEKRLTELAAISLVADMVPLLEESRTLTAFGLKVLNKTTRTGLVKLYETAGIVPGEITTQTIGYQIAPRINAAGRMDHANIAFALLNASDDGEATRLAIALNDSNLERQKATKTITDEVREQIIASSQEEAPVIVTYDERWPSGLCGLVSGNIVKEFNRPAFVFTKRNGEFVGSGRSIPEFNLIENLQKMADAFLRFGGHPGAAGMSIADGKFDDFKRRIAEIAAAEFSGKDLTPALQVDAELALADFNWDLENWLRKFEPHGMKNRTPLFLARDLSVVKADAVGAGGRHLRLAVCQDGGKAHKCIAFSFGEWAAELAAGDRIDAVFEVNVNEWNGSRELQLKIADLTRVKR